MQGQTLRPTNPDFIAYAGTPHEVWWDVKADAWVKPVSQGPQLDKIIQAYAAIRDARAVRKAQFDQDDAALEADQGTLRALLNQLMNESGAKSVATEAGTAYRVEKIKCSAADWGAINAWIIEQPDRIEIYEKRIKATFVKEFMDEHTNPPPGVNVHREFEVSVRRPTRNGKAAQQEETN